MQILIVEDNERNMKLLRDVLQASGYRTIGAMTGEEAVELARTHEVALVLMDVQLPGTDGVATLARLRDDERTAEIPVLAVTAQAMMGDRERFLAAGFVGYLSKPVDIAELVSTVREHLPTGGEAITCADGESACFAHLVCPECGVVLDTSDHRDGCTLKPETRNRR